MRWVEHRVLLEYQGREFHDSDEQRAQDEVRFKRFSDDGWSIVEVWTEDVNTDKARRPWCWAPLRSSATPGRAWS